MLFIAVAALLSEGALAGWLILGGLTFFALARSVASVTYKDVLGKTVGKARRGSATGLASSIAATTTILFAVLLFSEVGERRTLVIGALFVAAAAWVAAALLFSTLREEAGATERGANGIDQLRESLALLSQDPQLRRFILTRGLLTATALAPPFMVAAASAGSRDYGGLGLLIL
ncbi:MAG: MFS transporter, partial [Pseudomonadota bacterium]